MCVREAELLVRLREKNCINKFFCEPAREGGAIGDTGDTGAVRGVLGELGRCGGELPPGARVVACAARPLSSAGLGGAE